MQRSLLITAIILLTSHMAHAANRACSLPAILHITKPGTELVYQVDDRAPHRLYTLGEVSNAVRDCKLERMLFVVVSPEVPVGHIQSEPKEQIEHVRYFVQYAVNDFWELGTNYYYRALPITPDIRPEPLYDDTPPAPISKPKGSK